MNASNIAAAHARIPAAAIVTLMTIHLFQQCEHMIGPRLKGVVRGQAGFAAIGSSTACPQRHRICTIPIASGVPQPRQKTQLAVLQELM
jgi:hypothetical protein